MPRSDKGISAATLAARNYRQADMPMTAMLELADRCNETCVHCYQVQGQKGELHTDDWKQILDELAQMGVLFLILSGGEVTLRHDFLEICRYAREKQFAVKVYTNGLTMTRELARSLADLAVQEVQVSLYSHRAETHDWVTGVPGSFERTTQGVRHLVEYGVRVLVKTPVMSVNAEEQDEYSRLARELGAHFTLDPNLSAREDGTLEPHTMLSDDAQLRRTLAAQADLPAEELAPAPPDRTPCGACSTVHIEPNGEMRPCTALSVPVGDARQGVARAHHGPEARFIRGLTWSMLHGCRDCDLRSYCGRCHSEARLSGGDALGPYERACRVAVINYEVAHGVSMDVTYTDERRTGPFQRLGSGVFRTRPDRVTEADIARRAAHPWILRETAPVPPRTARPGELVQLRRPGRSKPSVERVPSALHHGE